MIRIRRAAWAAATGLVVLLPATSAAQSSGDGFLFREPRIQLGLRLGYAAPNAGSEIFDLAFEELTLDKQSFGTGSIGVDLAFRASERVDLVLSFGNASSTSRSEFRHWVGEDDLPIQQETTFTRRPFTVGARYYFQDRGRSISRFAWIPNRVAPYVGGGLGLMWYEFVQDGEFVDYQDLGIFESRFVSDGTTSTAHLFGGTEITVSPRVFVTAEGRYEWGSAELSQAFDQAFDNIDLSGFQLSVGVGLRF